MLATPTYTGKLAACHSHALVQSLWLLRDEGIDIDHLVLGENCHVDDARNVILREFMLSDCDSLIFLDADVGWRPSDLVKLIRHDKDVVAGIYPRRADNQDPFPVRMPEGPTFSHNGLVVANGASTGFMKIKRRVIEVLYEDNKHRRFAPAGEKPITIVFERTFEEGNRWSGDYDFCRKWQALGGLVHVDPEMLLMHEGTKEWTGSLGDYWRSLNNLASSEFYSAVSDLRNDKATGATWAALVNEFSSAYPAGPTLLAALYELALHADGPILETGSGLSTLVLALAAERTGNIVHSLEHDRGYYDESKALLKRHGINGSSKLLYAPLREYADDAVWYETPYGMAGDYALVFCDGPQRRFGRDGLFRFASDRIQRANVVADDADGGELTYLEEWAKDNHRFVKYIKGDGQRTFAICPKP
jgi:hypothetical protein